ncbi:MAG: helix-turn-helix domain-containing protein, partial [Planctomycetota bacterium]
KVTGGNREEAAGMLGIGERTLYRKIKEYGLN